MQTPVSYLEKQREEFKEHMAKRDAALRLFNNPDFKLVIVEGFMLHEAARYVQTSCDPSLDADKRADALALAQASGHLKRFMSVTVQMGNHAEHELPSLDSALEEARAESGE